MLKSVKSSKAEEQFAATQKKDKQVLKDKEKLQNKSTEKMAALKALRLAKEAVDKIEADKIAAEKESAKTKKKKKKK